MGLALRTVPAARSNAVVDAAKRTMVGIPTAEAEPLKWLAGSAVVCEG